MRHTNLLGANIRLLVAQSSSFFSPARRLTTQIKQNNPAIAEIYSALLNQSHSAKPIACNFVSQIVDQWAEKRDKIALRCIDQESGQRSEITYTKLVKHSQQIAHFFAENHLGKGSTVALMLGQRPAWWYTLAGLIRAGIAVVPCPRLLTPKDLSYRIQDLGIDGIVTAPELQARIEAVRMACPTLKTFITTGTSNERWISIDDIINRKATLPSVETTTDDPCLYLYTSGTTGQPKAVQHNADYPFFHWPTGRRWLKATEDDLIYNASDTGWGFTVWITTAAWAMGSQLLITPTNSKFKPEQMLAILRDEPVTIFCAAPTVLRMLAAHPDFDRFDFPTLKRIVTVGEALDETVINRFYEKGVEIAVGFGQAETPLLVGRTDEAPHHPGTMGKPIDPYKVVVLDDEFKPLFPGNIGQIAVDLVDGKHGGIMRGYANAPEKTKNSRSPDGRYYLTGDYAKLLPDSLLAYQGRRDDLIKSRGYRIGPDEVEKAGMSHPAVAKIAVVGIRTAVDSPAITVKAFILLKTGYQESPSLIQDIQAHIKGETGAYKYPRLVECLSLEEWEQYETTSGKIRRVGLREREERKLIATLQPDNDRCLKPA